MSSVGTSSPQNDGGESGKAFTTWYSVGTKCWWNDRGICFPN